jgi:hypothetical protein
MRCTERLGGDEGDRDVRIAGRVAPHGAQRGGGDDQGWRRPVAGAEAECVEECEGDPGLPEPDGVSEEGAAVGVECAVEAGDGELLMRSEDDRSDARGGGPGRREIERRGGEGRAHIGDDHGATSRARVAQAGSRTWRGGGPGCDADAGATR